MRKTIRKCLTILYIALLIGTVLVSCGPIFDDGGDNGDNGDNPNPPPPPPPPPPSEYEEVKAYDARDLAGYLESDETSYIISLEEIENKNIYLQRNISIVRPMKIIGSAEKIYTIHSVNRDSGNAYYCLDLQSNLDLEYCGFTGYAATSGTSTGVPAGSPPLNIRAGMTLTMTGKDSVLELRGVGSPIALRTGSQVKLGDGVSIVDNSEVKPGDLLFNAGVEKLALSGKISLKSNLKVRPNAILQIDSGGELRVEPGAILTLNADIKELRLDGNIVVDRTASPAGTLVTTGLAEGTLLGKITGNGSLNIENGVTGTIESINYGVNTVIRLNGHGINLEKRVSSAVGGEARLIADHTMPKEKTLLVGSGMELNVNNTKLTLAGGTLDVAGSVNVTNGGEIILNAVENFQGIPKGEVSISNNGTITIDGGTFTDKSAPPNASIFTFPSYGAGSLIIKDTGHAIMGTDEDEVIGGGSNPLSLGANSTLTIRTASNAPEFTLRGTGTLAVPTALALEGRFIIAAGAVLTVSGNNTLTVRAPNQLAGTATNPIVDQLTIGSGAKVEIYSTSTSTSPLELDGGNNYEWSGSSPSWH